MKTFLNRFVARVLLLFLFIMLCFQYPAMAHPDRGNDGDGLNLPSRFEVFLETLRPSVANPEGSQPAPGQTRGSTGGGDGRDRQGAGGRDAGQRERNKESGHKGFGGPQ